MRSKTLIALAIAAAMTLATCGGETAETTTSVAASETTTTTSPQATTTTESEGPVFVGADGVETTITDISRIVSLNGDLTEIIFELGLGDNVVGVDVTTTYPPEAAALNDQGQTVGFAQQLTAEAVLRFEPTLVIGDTQVAPPEAIEQLRGAGIPVVILETQTTLDGVETKINQVAEILDVPDEGATLAERVMGEINAARDLAAGEDSDPRVAFVYVRGPQVVFLFGAGMATQAMIEGAGAVDAGVESGVFGPAPLTPEALVAAAPEVIVLPEAGLEALGGIEAFLALPGVSDTPAAQNDAFFAYDEAYFFNLGPRTGQALDEFVRDLYPGIGG
ncbi:MAG TPA: ABC transporter substrate-binding protein [Acidimicrobiia bacterium]|nr:ABC transporter substrate-binding protein [Acidimicrobiia bacterium]